MHTLEPYYRWRNYYVASQDSRSPFYGRTYSEFQFSTKIYNYYIHPQWDDFGSETLYTKILFANYEIGFVVLEMIGEWNDCLHNDIMFFKQGVIDPLQQEGINKFIVIAENVLAYHASDDCYYEEWYEDIEEDGWICFMGLNDQILEEMSETGIHHYVNIGPDLFINWRPLHPNKLYQQIESML